MLFGWDQAWLVNDENKNQWIQLFLIFLDYYEVCHTIIITDSKNSTNFLETLGDVVFVEACQEMQDHHGRLSRFPNFSKIFIIPFV